MAADSPVRVTPSVCQALAGLQDPMDHRLHSASMRGIGEAPGGIECISGPPQREGLGRHPTLQIKWERSQVALRPQPTYRPGRRVEHTDHFACKWFKSVLLRSVRFDRAGRPIDGVFQQCGVAAVVLGRANDPRWVVKHDLL